jgi:hypothetical protein
MKKVKFIAFEKQDQNDALIDPWSVVHFATGLAFGLIGIRGSYTLVAGVAWDIVEHFLERAKFGQRFFNTSGPESWGNVGTDLALFMGGWKLGQLYNSTGPAKNPKLNPTKARERRAAAQEKNFGRLTRSSKKPSARGMRQREGANSPSFRDQVAGTINLFP